MLMAACGGSGSEDPRTQRERRSQPSVTHPVDAELTVFT